MKKKGFTLIELLAVVVILAIVALIAIPALTKLIENVKIGVVKNSVYGMMEAGELSYIYNEQDIEDGQLTYTCDGKSCKTESGTVLKFKGKVPDEGDISISKDKSSDASFIKFGEYCAYGTRENLDVWKGKCEFEAGLYNSKNKLVVPWDEIETKYDVSLRKDFYMNDHIPGDSKKQSLKEILNDNDKYPELSDIKKVIIKKGVWGISSYALFNTNNLDEVYLPNTLSYIGSSAFKNSGIKKINFSSSLKKIESGAFESCKNLESVIMPKSIETIGIYVFKNCTNLKSIKISNSMVEIPERLCYGCSKLSNVILGKNVRKIGDSAFYATSLSDLDIPSTVTEIGNQSFYKTKIESINIPNNVIKIGTNAFSTSTLKNISIGSGLEEMDYSAFQPTYDSNNIIENIKISKDNNNYEDRGLNAIFDKNNKVLVLASYKTSLIPDDIIKIGKYAFKKIKKEFNIKIGKNIKSIGAGVFDSSGLKKIEFDNGIETIERDAFVGTKIETVILPNSLQSLGYQSFSSINTLKKVVLPDNLKVIPKSCFASDSFGKKLDINIPKYVEEIDDYAFNATDLLNNDVFANEDSFPNLKRIGSNAFKFSNLNNIYIGPNVESIGIDALGSVNTIKVSNQNINYTDMNSNNIIEKNTNKLLIGSSYSTFPDGIKRIGFHAFYRVGLKNKNVVLPESVETIDGNAFAEASISNIEFNSNLKQISIQAFNKYYTGWPNTISKTATFKNPNGWYLTKDKDATSGEAIDLSNPEKNASNLSSDKLGYYWKRND